MSCKGSALKNDKSLKIKMKTDKIKIDTNSKYINNKNV